MPRGSNFQKPYPPEFRREAVALYRGSGRSLNEVAGDLGISTETLRVWAAQAEVDAGKREGLTSAYGIEIRRQSDRPLDAFSKRIQIECVRVRTVMSSRNGRHAHGRCGVSAN